MICYRDMTFVDSAECDCHRKLTPEVVDAARKWCGKDGAPIAISDRCICAKRVSGETIKLVGDE